MGGLTLKPTGVLTLVETYLVGPETPGTNDSWRHFSDTVLTYTAGPRLSLMANYDYGRDHGVHWQGIAGYLKYQPTQAIAFSPRFEFYDDASGFTTGTVQKVKELTGTLEEPNSSPSTASTASAADSKVPALRVQSGKIVAASCSE